MERLAVRTSDPTIHVYGFDLGTGLPACRDRRDLPHIWREGFFAMDEGRLRASLDCAQLIIGDIVESLAAFLEQVTAPIGFMSFDMDYYTSTQAALRCIMGAVPEAFMPRVVAYFDDTVGPHDEWHCDLAGELLAIKEHNEQGGYPIRRVHGLAHKLQMLAPWVPGVHVMHVLSHPRVTTNTPTRRATDRFRWIARDRVAWVL